MINLKSPKEIEIMREGGQILAQVLDELESRVAVGAKLADLDALADTLIREKGGAPSFKGYTPDFASQPYPASVCLSLNDEVVHGLPSSRVRLGEGDLVKIDLGVFYKGFHTDSARTIIVSQGSKDARALLATTEQALERAIGLVRPGIHLGDLGHAIESYVREHGYSVIRTLSGHGIGRELHEEPNIPNFGKPGEGPELVEGMTFAIEPMVAAGKGEVYLAEDGFTYKTRDGSSVAHFEHTVAVTKDGHEVLTIL